MNQSTAAKANGNPAQKSLPPPPGKPEPQAPPGSAKPATEGQQPAGENLESLRDYLFKNRDRIDQEASTFLRGNNLIERLISVAALLVHKDPKKKLQACTKASVLEALRECARLGLWIGGHKPQGYFVPYGTQCVFQVSYFGMIALMRRSGLVTDVRAGIVHKGDAFFYELGLRPDLTHKPHLGEHKKDDWTHVYAVIKIKGSADPLIEVMTKGEVLLVRGRSKAADGPWVTDEERMAVKTVVRRAAKFAPMPEDLEMTLAEEDSIDAVVIDRKEVRRGSDGLEQALAAQPALSEPAPRETIEPAHDKEGVVVERQQTGAVPAGMRDNGDGVVIGPDGQPV